jgi:phosphate transport system substrate-binding protein
MRKQTEISIVALMLFALSSSAAGAQNLVVQGSTTFTHRVMEPYQKAIEASSGQQLTVVPNKSSLGLLALFDKRADFAMISGPLETEIDGLKQANPGLPYGQLQSFEISNTRMAFAVNEANPVREMTSGKMRAILLGEITDWTQVGGQGLKIRVVQVRNGGGVQASIEGDLLGGKAVNAPNPILVQISSQVVKVVEQLPEALGLSQLSIVKKSNTAELNLDHPIEQHLKLITLGDPSPEMLKVINAAREIASTSLDR